LNQSILLKTIGKPSNESLLFAFQDSKKIHYQANEFLFHEGDSIQYLDLLIEGSIQIFKYDGNQNEVTLNFFNPVSIVAEWAVLLGIPYPASAKFVKPSIIHRMTLDSFQQNLNTNVAFNHIIMHSLIGKIEIMNSTINRGLTMDSLHRVAHFIFHATEEILKLKQNQIASLLYLRPETFSRILKQLKDQGTIRIEKGRIEILNRDDLKELIS
jgi:CRP/FNR family transcriptional regulator